LVEAGGTLLASFIENMLFDKLYLFQAPVVLGGEKSPGFVAGKGASSLKEALRLERGSIRHLGDDILFEYYPGSGFTDNKEAP